jgi:hypothetical protein
MRGTIAVLLLALLACLIPCHVSLASGTASSILMQQETECSMPPGLDGITGHVVFGYLVDGKGRVTHARPLYDVLEPRHQHGRVIDVLRSCLEERHHPIVSRWYGTGSVPVLTSFHFFRPAPQGVPVHRFPGGRLIPRTWLHEMRREKWRLTRSLLDGPMYREVAGDGWYLRSDVDARTLEAILDAPDFARAVLDILIPAAPGEDGEDPVTISVFGDLLEFNQVAAFDNFVLRAGFPAGQYTSWDRMIYVSAPPDTPLERTAGVLAHEMTHDLLTQRIRGGARPVPFWLSEGLATFVECLKRNRGGRIDLAAVERRSMFRGRFQWEAPAAHHVDRLAAAVASSGLPSLAVLLEAGEDGVVPIPRDLAYATSWLLVHYLVNAQGGKLREPFLAWVSDPASEPGPDGLAAALGRPLSAIQKALPRYLRKLR